MKITTTRNIKKAEKLSRLMAEFITGDNTDVAIALPKGGHVHVSGLNAGVTADGEVCFVIETSECSDDV